MALFYPGIHNGREKNLTNNYTSIKELFKVVI